jgi:hypothetical protein
VNLNANPAAASKPAAAPAATFNNTSILVGGAVLALLIIAIAAFAIARSRRRRREEQELADAQSLSYEPFEAAAAPEPEVYHEQPATAEPEPAAFAWGAEQPVATQERAPEDDRRPGETWVERAYRGPSPANPSASLKTRLKRAAFFDKRERDVAAGIAQPVDPDAGLPEAMDDDERELA